jgi:phage regulator Rha-like protein
MEGLIPVENIAQKIYLIRGQKVMLDTDLAVFYGVEVKRLNEQIKRNMERFPENFCFQLNEQENESLRRQIGTSNLKSQNVTSRLRSQIATSKRGGRRYLPYAFTEHGVVMLSSVLRSRKAAQVSIAVVNAFIKMREYLATHGQILEKLKKYDENFVIIFDVLKQLTAKPKTATGKFGFKAGTVKPT